MLSKASKLALKANKVYSDNTEWLVYYHALSGDELKTQILTIGHKPTDKIISYPFSELSGEYKKYEIDGLKNRLQKDFNDDPSYLIQHVLQFLNDAKIEYTGKPFIEETV